MALLRIQLEMLNQPQIALCVLLIVFLHGCGFHLRGNIELPPGLEMVAIDDVSTTSSLAQVLKTQLRRFNITLVKNIDDAKLVIVINSEGHQRRVMTVSPEGKVQEFELIYTVNYSLLNKENPEMSVIEQNLSVKRDLRFDETAVLGVTSEETRLKQDMVSSSAEQILRRLQNVAGAKPAKGK